MPYVHVKLEFVIKDFSKDQYCLIKSVQDDFYVHIPDSNELISVKFGTAIDIGAPSELRK